MMTELEVEFLKIRDIVETIVEKDSKFGKEGIADFQSRQWLLKILDS